MPLTALRNLISEYAQPGERKPPTTETNPWPSVSRSSIPNRLVPAATEDTKPIPSELAFHAVVSPQERLMNAREVAARLGVSERWVRDHTTRRSPKIRGVKLGTLMRYRRADVDEFMERLATSSSSSQRLFGR